MTASASTVIVLLTSLLYATLFIHRPDAASIPNPLPSYPLAVKNPYLSTWVPGNQLNDASTAQPQFWDGTQLRWPILGRVNGKVYALFGNLNGSNATAATTQSVTFTSSHTYITLSAGVANFTLDFFSPVLPGTNDYARQSLPYSYLTVNVTGPNANVQVLSGIDYTWTAQGGASKLNYTSTANTGFFWFFNPSAYHFSQVANGGQMATYGSVLYGTTTGTGMTFSCNGTSEVFSMFASTGALGTSYSGCGGTDLAALSKNLGTVGTGGAKATFTVGFDRVFAINYLNSVYTGLYRQNWSTVQDAVQYVLTDNLSPALATASSLDTEIAQRAASVSSVYGGQYATIVQASVRQAFGAMELTVPLTAQSPTSPYVFLKEISSDGNVNTVDIMFQTWPIFVSLNPNYIRFFFAPILAYLQSGKWPRPYVIHDIGGSYPNATGHNDGKDEFLPIYETSTLFILLMVYEKYTGDKSVSQQYSSILNGYAAWLANNTLYPASQLTSVDVLGLSPNQTALAVQGTIGLKAAANITGNATYASIASSYVQKIYNQGLGLDGATPANSTHFTYQYGNSTTWNVLFASYSDVLLGLNTFPAAAWTMQSDWYQQVIQPGGLPWAGPINNPYYTQMINWGLTDWNIEVAAISSSAVQQAIVNTTYTFLTNRLNAIPFGTKYVVEGSNIGKWLQNRARSTVGTHFAILALKQGYWYNG